MIINNRWKKIERSKNIYLPTIQNFDLINKDTKVCLMGSCFADEMGWVLKENQINIGEVDCNYEMKHVMYPWGTFFTPMNLFNIIDIIFEDKIKKLIDEQSFIKVPKNLIGNHYESSSQFNNDKEFNLWCLFIKARLQTNEFEIATKQIYDKLNNLKNSIINANVIIITLGLIETWIDRNKKFAWHSFHGDAFKKKSIDDLAFFHQLKFEEVKNYINKITSLILGLGNKKIIFTISPIPLNFTFTNNDIVLANKYSKSVLRSAVEEFIDNKKIFYFPSFEIVQDCVGWPNSFKEDKRHVKIEVFKEYIAPTFINAFTNFYK